MGSHLQPIVGRVSDMMADESSVSKTVLFSLVRLLVVFVVIGIVLVLGRLVQSILGAEIVAEEEIVVVHEYATEEEARKARAAASRGKKHKSS